MFAGERLDRGRRTTVGVTLTQNRVHGTAESPGVTGVSFLFLVGFGMLPVLRELVTLLVKLLDGRAKLRDRGADVGQLDDVGVRVLGVVTQLGQCIDNTLVFFEVVRKGGQDAGSQGDIAGLEGNACRRGKGLQDRQQGAGRQRRRLVGQRIDNRGGAVFIFVLWIMDEFRTVTIYIKSLVNS
jgi:hypothetical protein